MDPLASIPKNTSYFLACAALLIFLFGKAMDSTSFYHSKDETKASDMVGDGESKFYLDWVMFSAAAASCLLGGFHLAYTSKRR